MAAEVVRELAAKVSVVVDGSSFARANKSVEAVKAKLANLGAASQRTAQQQQLALLLDAKTLRERFRISQQFHAANEARERQAAKVLATQRAVARKYREREAQRDMDLETRLTQARLGGSAEGGGGMGAGGAIGIAAAVGWAAKRAFLDFNDAVEQSTISLAAQQQMLGKSGTWGEAMQTATGLFSHYQQVAKSSVGTTRDFLTMHQAIAATAYRSGLDLEGIKEITKGAVIVGSILGERADVTALDIKQMLAGTVSVRDRVAQTLISSQKKTHTQFNAMSQKQRAELVRTALTAPGIQNAAKEMEKSFAGVTSTLKDNLEIALGKTGLPLFKAITKEIDRWNQWIDKNPEKFQAILDALAAPFNQIKAGFQVVNSVMGPVVGQIEAINAALNSMGSLANRNPLGAMFRGITAPITTAVEEVQDLYRYLTGEASAIGASMQKTPEAQNAYEEHRRRGGKFNMTGGLVPLPGTPGATGGAPTMAGQYWEAFNTVGAKTNAYTLGSATLRNLGAGNYGDALATGLGTVASVPQLLPEMIIRTMAGQANKTTTISAPVNVVVNSSGPADGQSIAQAVSDQMSVDLRQWSEANP